MIQKGIYGMEMIKINKDLCVNCGFCVKECPTFALEMSEEGPKTVLPQNCFACGHCTAVCPKGALDNSKAPFDRQGEKILNLNFNMEAAEQFMRSRRSIRNYKQDAVPRELLTKLVDLARYAPTGGNVQGISFLVVEDKKKVEKAAELTIEWLEKGYVISEGFIPSFIKMYREKGIDSILRDAPHLILTIAENTFSQGRECSISMLTYLELFAPVLGLGSCWAGVFELCAMSGYEPIIELFGIPEGKNITGAVMIGYPQYLYKRLPDRNPLEVSFR